jgi:phospholipid transport system substrate-binding protein
MRSRRPFVVLALVLALAVTLLTGRWAVAGVPTEQLKAQIDRVLKTLEDPELKKEGRAKDRRVAVRKIANEIFDFSETARRSLGRHWQGRTQAERDEFVQLFSDLLERSYITKIETYGGEKIQYNGDTAEGDQAKVQTKLITKGSGGEIPIEYRMHKVGDRWLVYDVVIEGVSLVANYRTQFNKIIQTSSFQELMNKMKNKQQELITGQS